MLASPEERKTYTLPFPRSIMVELGRFWDEDLIRHYAEQVRELQAKYKTKEIVRMIQRVRSNKEKPQANSTELARELEQVIENYSKRTSGMTFEVLDGALCEISDSLNT